jgi:alpha(1,3/1,4) fucosyltransferase
MAPRDVALFIDPPSYHFVGDRLFDPATTRFSGDDNAAPWLHLRDWFGERGVDVHTADYLVEGRRRRRRNVFVSLGLRKRCRAVENQPDVALSAFFAFESPVVEPALYRGLADVERRFQRVFTFAPADSLTPFLRAPLRSEIFRLPQHVDSVREDLWSRGDRKFLVMINNNRLPAIRWNELYTERLRALDHFAPRGEIDLYGKGWDEPPYQMGIGWMPGTLQKLIRKVQTAWQRIRPLPSLAAARHVYKGTVASKLDALSRYTFSICFENVVLDGWVTEKIFDCFAAGTIPIYWGAADIERLVDPDCFIDMRRFGSYDELGRGLRSLGEPEIRRYRERAREFLRSERYAPFTKEAFTARLARIVEEDTGVAL